MNFFQAVSAAITPTGGGGGGIVTAGLQLNLDAANAASYPGSGNTWFDLVNGHNVTMKNGASYVPTAGGAFSFDGVNDVGHNTTFPWASLVNCTIECWLYPTKTSSDGTFFGAQWGNPPGQGHLMYLDVGDGAYGYDGVWNVNTGVIRNGTRDPNATANAWQHVVCIFNGNGATCSCSLFVNNVLRNTSFGGTSIDSSSNLGFGIGTENSFAVARLWGGLIAEARVYDTPFTAIEVDQNFNATKSRYGL